MSLKAISAAWQARDISPTAKLVLLALADHANDEGVAWPSLRRLCAFTGLARSTVCRGLRDLEAAGLISCLRGGPEGRASNRYRITWPRGGPDSFASAQDGKAATKVPVNAPDRGLPVPAESPMREEIPAAERDAVTAVPVSGPRHAPRVSTADLVGRTYEPDLFAGEDLSAMAAVPAGRVGMPPDPVRGVRFPASDRSHGETGPTMKLVALSDGGGFTMGPQVVSPSDPNRKGTVRNRHGVADLLWQAAPPRGRTRSSARQVAAALQAVPPSALPPAEDLLAALEAWKASADWRKDGGEYVPGLHLWIRNRKWQHPPDGTVPAAPGAARSGAAAALMAAASSSGFIPQFPGHRPPGR